MATDYRYSEILKRYFKVALEQSIPALSSIDYTFEPDLKGKSSISIRKIVAPSLQEYTGANLSFAETGYLEETMSLSTKKYIAEKILRLDTADMGQAKTVLMEKAALGVAKVKDEMEDKIANHYSDVKVANVIHAEDSELSVSSSNIFTALNNVVTKMREDKVPSSQRYILVPPVIYALLEEKFALNTHGDKVMKISAIDANIVLSSSSNLTYTNTGSDSCYRLLGYHKSFIAGAIGLNEVAVGEFGAENFGWYIKGLFLYDTKVFTTLGVDNYAWLDNVKISSE